MAYTSKSKINLPVYGIKNKDLREFQTTTKDVEKGISRIPMQIARLYEEDILEDDDNYEPCALMTEPPEILDNYTKMIEERKEAYTKSKSRASVASDEYQAFGDNS